MSTLRGKIYKVPTISGQIYSPEFVTAYSIAVRNGFVGSEEEWLESLKGDAGKSAYEIAVEHGFPGTIDEWLSQIGGVVEHNVLLGREQNNAHPISAISNLDVELNNKQAKMDKLSFNDIYDICT